LNELICLINNIQNGGFLQTFLAVSCPGVKHLPAQKGSAHDSPRKLSPAHVLKQFYGQKLI